KGPLPRALELPTPRVATCSWTKPLQRLLLPERMTVPPALLSCAAEFPMYTPPLPTMLPLKLIVQFLDEATAPDKKTLAPEKASNSTALVTTTLVAVKVRRVKL